MFGTDHYDLLDKFVKQIIAYNHFASHPKWALYTIIEDKIRLFYVYFAHCFGLLKEFPAFLQLFGEYLDFKRVFHFQNTVFEITRLVGLEITVIAEALARANHNVQLCILEALSNPLSSDKNTSRRGEQNWYRRLHRIRISQTALANSIKSASCAWCTGFSC